MSCAVIMGDTVIVRTVVLHYSSFWRIVSTQIFLDLCMSCAVIMGNTVIVRTVVLHYSSFLRIVSTKGSELLCQIYELICKVIYRIDCHLGECLLP